MVSLIIFVIHVLESFLQSVLIVTFAWLINILARRNLFELATFASDFELDVTEIGDVLSALLTKDTFAIDFECERVTISALRWLKIIITYAHIWWLPTSDGAAISSSMLRRPSATAVEGPGPSKMGHLSI